VISSIEAGHPVRMHMLRGGTEPPDADTMMSGLLNLIIRIKIQLLFVNFVNIVYNLVCQGKLSERQFRYCLPLNYNTVNSTFQGSIIDAAYTKLACI